MVAEANRGIVFTLKARTDESVGAEFGKLEERTAQLQKLMGNMKLGGLDVGQLQTSVEAAHASIDSLQEKARKPINLAAYSTSQVATQQPAYAGALAGRSLPTSGGPEPVLPEAPKPSGTQSAAIANADKLKAALEKSVADNKAAEAKMTADAKAETDKRAALPDKIVKNRIAMLARVQQFEADQEGKERAAADKQIAQIQKTVDAEAKASAKREKANAAAVDKVIADWDKEAEHEEKAAEKAEAAHERAANRVITTSIRLRRALGEVAASSTELARGFVELGLVGEEDMEKIKDAILGVQSAVDLVRGGINTWNSLAEAAHLYHERIEASRKAAQALAAVQAAGKATSALGAAGSAAGAGAGSLSGAGAIGGLVAAAGPAALVIAALAAAALAAKFALDKFTEAAGEGERKDREARQKELEIREQQNASLQKIFAAEDRARQQTSQADALALRVSQNFGEKRGQYEAEADRRGLQGDARQQFMQSQGDIDQKTRRLAEIDKEIEQAEKNVERSRNANNELAVPGAAPKGPSQAGFLAGLLGGAKSAIGGVVAGAEGGDQSIHHAAGFNQFAADEEAERQAAEKLNSLAQERAELEEQTREAKQQQFRAEAAYWNQSLEKQQELIQGDRERVKQAKEYADAQKKAADDAVAAFGQLSINDRKRLVEVQKKLDRGEQLNDSELELGRRGLGEKGKAQIREQDMARVSPEERELLFGNEDARAGEAQEKLGSELERLGEHVVDLATIMQRVAELNARAEGGEKAEVAVNAEGHATLEIKWDQPSSQLIAQAMQEPLAEWRGAIEQMLQKSISAARQEWIKEVERLIQRKSQKGNAAA